MLDFLRLVQNLALLVALHVIVGFVDLRRHTRQWEPVVQGVPFGTVMILGMVRTVEPEKGVIYDGRPVVASLCGLFFRPVAAGIVSRPRGRQSSPSSATGSPG